jgi:hypothetical protein
VPAAGDDAGAFLDSWVAHASEQPDARCDVLARLGSIARGERRGQQRSEQQSFYFAPGHIGGGCVQVNNIALLNPIGESLFVGNENLSPTVSYPLFMSAPNDASLASSIVDVI